jgi:hypothetical protein
MAFAIQYSETVTSGKHAHAVCYATSFGLEKLSQVVRKGQGIHALTPLVCSICEQAILSTSVKIALAAYERVPLDVSLVILDALIEQTTLHVYAYITNNLYVLLSWDGTESELRTLAALCDCEPAVRLLV